MEAIRLPHGWETWPEPRKVALRDQLRLAKFRLTYRNDPTAFVHDCFTWPEGEGPTKYQDEILDKLQAEESVAVRGPHSIGKTALASWAILWFTLTRDLFEDWKAPTTASAWRQLREYLWPDLHKWVRLIDWAKIGRQPWAEPRELQDMAIRLTTGAAFAVASDQPASIEGAHADQLLYIYDEAKTIPEDTWDATAGAFMGAGVAGRQAFRLALSTPGEPSGRFYAIHRRDPAHLNWWVRHVRLEEAIKAERISQSTVEDFKRMWGAASSIYANRVLGEFAASDESAVIPLGWVEAAIERWRELSVTDIASRKQSIPEGAVPPFSCVGVDVADEGGDQTCLALRCGDAIVEVRTHPLGDTMETTGRVKGILQARERGYAVVDVIGIGAGVVARLKEQELDVRAFNASGKSRAKDRSGELEMLNLRAEVWWGMRERLDPSQPGGSQIALPPNDLLVGDLTAPRYSTTSAGKIQVEDKDSIRKRLGRSPDVGDAVVMAFWATRTGPARVSNPSRSQLPGVVSR